MSELRKAIAIDFDGCLCKNMWPDIGLPNFDAINAAIQARQEGAALILWTCRVGEKLESAIQFCKNYGLEFDAVNDNLPERVAFYNANPRKVNADEYWDDLSIFVSAADSENRRRFTGGPGDDTIKIVKPTDSGVDSLEPCPFCGGSEVVYELYGHGAGERWRCWCTSCLAGIDPGWAQDRFAVRDMWNRRPEKPNDPLTLDELREMNGEPVWVETPWVDREISGRWVIVDGVNLEKKVLFTRGDFTCHDYGKVWLAYRRKPKEEK